MADAQAPTPDFSLLPLEPPVFSPDQLLRLNNYAILLTQSLGLSEGQLNDLLILIKVSCVDHMLSYGQMYWNIFSAAQDLHNKNFQQQEILDKKAINELTRTTNQRLKNNFELTRDQNIIIINRAKKVIGEAQRINYKNTALEVEAKLTGLEVFEGCWEDDIPKTVIRKACKTKAKDTCGTLRLDLYKGLVGAGQCSLTSSTIFIVTRYCDLPADKVIPIKYQVHIALLRRYILEQAWGDWVDEFVNADGETTTVKRKAPSGKVPQGEDFWSKVEAWLLKLTKEFGAGWTGEKWETYIKETVRLDHEKYNVEKHSSMENLPAEYYQQTPPSSTIPPAAPAQANAQPVVTGGSMFSGALFAVPS